MTGAGGTFVISWDQTETDGRRAAGPEALGRGATWRWDGTATRIEGGPGLLELADAADRARLRAVARRHARRLVAAAGVGLGTSAASAGGAAPDPSDGLDLAPADGFLVTDGRRAWRVMLLTPALGGTATRPPLAFEAEMPPAGRELWIVDVSLRRLPPAAQATPLPGIGAETAVATPGGLRPAGTLRPGDLVLTRGGGAQPILWTGQRRLGPARLAALPAERPLALAAGSPGLGNAAALVLGPGQLLCHAGPAVAELFGVPEVLLAARTLEGRTGVARPVPAAGCRLVWLMLPGRYLLDLDGAGAESFDPEAAAPLLTPAERAALDRFPRFPAAPGLRRVGAGQAALLAHAPAPPPAALPARQPPWQPPLAAARPA
ncbi:Hint domain-containing protein [Frigidibacter sp. MR17.24]|uniref:Hint domain-containing protein n=1 Tax=Frigidibacter sp. MR17.24 TaxID=3127345 RepID=UPI00301308C3